MPLLSPSASSSSSPFFVAGECFLGRTGLFPPLTGRKVAVWISKRKRPVVDAVAEDDETMKLPRDYHGASNMQPAAHHLFELFKPNLIEDVFLRELASQPRLLPLAKPHRSKSCRPQYIKHDLSETSSSSSLSYRVDHKDRTALCPLPD